MLIAVDVGNTVIKIAIMEKDSIIELKRCDQNSFKKTLLDIHKKYPKIDNVALCIVGKFSKSLKHFIHQHFTVFTIDKNIKLPFNNIYQSDSLGNDRIALVAGTIINNGITKNTLIIDAGTCITYDFIDKDLNYYGGAISPGLRLRYESLHNYTANLPLLTQKENANLIGNTTADSIHSGIINGLQLEIKGFIKQYKKQNKDLNVFITGGDATVLSTRLKNRFFATPFLMLQGIYNLYTYNKSL